jgi:hypothetical protein
MVAAAQGALAAMEVLVPTGPEDPSKGISHGGPHWDVQTGGRRPGYENIRPVRP